jgi:hypothetical protein
LGECQNISLDSEGLLYGHIKALKLVREYLRGAPELAHGGRSNQANMESIGAFIFLESKNAVVVDTLCFW